MKFNIEEYLVTEETDVNELQEEYKDNIDTLKKAGLDTIVSGIEDNEDKSNIPFKQLDKKCNRIINAVFDTSWSTSSFNREIPLRVASLIALSKDKEYFKDVNIRGDFPNQNPMFSSFIAIGRDKEGDDYLIARWSLHPLDSFDTLKEKAIPKIKKKLQLKIQENINEATKDLDNLDSLVEDYINNKWIKYYI